MHVTLKNLPRLHLADLLRRRKTTLTAFIQEAGIQAYGALVERCAALGVQPPTEAEYTVIVPERVSSQQDGVIVVDPFPVIDEFTGKEIDPDVEPIEPGVKVIIDAETESSEPTVDTQKKQKKKKDRTAEESNESTGRNDKGPPSGL